jgi:hypothetical protein
VFVCTTLAVLSLQAWQARCTAAAALIRLLRMLLLRYMQPLNHLNKHV